MTAVANNPSITDRLLCVPLLSPQMRTCRGAVGWSFWVTQNSTPGSFRLAKRKYCLTVCIASNGSTVNFIPPVGCMWLRRGSKTQIANGIPQASGRLPMVVISEGEPLCLSPERASVHRSLINTPENATIGYDGDIQTGSRCCILRWHRGGERGHNRHFANRHAARYR